MLLTKLKQSLKFLHDFCHLHIHFQWVGSFFLHEREHDIVLLKPQKTKKKFMFIENSRIFIKLIRFMLEEQLYISEVTKMNFYSDAISENKIVRKFTFVAKFTTAGPLEGSSRFAEFFCTAYINT